MEISNSPLVLVYGCTFTNNTSMGIGKERYSGNSGGLSIGFDDFPLVEHIFPEILIIRSNFSRNKALADDPQFQYSVSEVIGQRLYNQRGGAIACYFGAKSYSGQILVMDTLIEENQAKDSVGGVYMFLAGASNAHKVWFKNTMLLRNVGPDGGGLEITQSPDEALGSPFFIHISDCMFMNTIGNFWRRL